LSKSISKDTFGDKRFSEDGGSQYSDESQDSFDENEEQKFIQAERQREKQLLLMDDNEQI